MIFTVCDLYKYHLRNRHNNKVICCQNPIFYAEEFRNEVFVLQIRKIVVVPMAMWLWMKSTKITSSEIMECLTQISNNDNRK